MAGVETAQEEVAGNEGREAVGPSLRWGFLLEWGRGRGSHEASFLGGFEQGDLSLPIKRHPTPLAAVEHGRPGGGVHL